MDTSYGPRWWTVFFVILILVVGSGCAHRGYRIRGTSLDSLPVRKEIAEVPFYPQESNQCGPASLAMVLNWSGSQIPPREIADEIYTSGRKGSLQPLMISATRYHGRLPYVIRDFESLIQEVAVGHPVIVLQNLGLSWYPQWHYAVLIGYDIEKQRVTLRSGEVFRKERSWSVFHRTWERAGKWGMVALPLTELPASADEDSYLEAVVALENVKKYRAASLAYETALKRWPESLGALMGLGNCSYALGELAEAEEAFRRAVNIFQTCGDAYNNLAHVLGDQRCYEEALDAAREAIDLGGPNIDIYCETLEEITRLKEKDSGGRLPCSQR
jgi:tetratricopeptide (TPR) repeat protein